MTIQVGEFREIVQLGTKLTAAEVVAAEQILTTGKQTIQIGIHGDAEGGTVTLNKSLLTAIDNSLGGSIGSLTISQGVKVVDAVKSLSVSGELSNYGSLLTASTSRGTTDTISAGTILNADGGSIGSYSGGGGLHSASPSLDASISLTNSGSISSAGNLNISAPVINNLAAPGAALSPVPTISAQHNVNLNTQTINNGGTIDATKGNINIESNNANLNLAGGNYLSNQLNLDAGAGNITLNVNEVTGVVNANGNCIHLNANTPELMLGKIDASGDPLVTNSNDIFITGAGFAPTNGADLTVISMGNILGGKGNKGLDTSSKTGPGGNLALIAGAQFSIDMVTGAATVTGSSTNGGIIDLTGTGESSGAVTSIKTAGGAGQNAGSVTLVAFSGGTFGTGTINTSKTAINTTTKAPGLNGDITLIGDGQVIGPNPPGVTAGTIRGGNVTISTGSPSEGGGVIYEKTG